MEIRKGSHVSGVSLWAILTPYESYAISAEEIERR